MDQIQKIYDLRSLGYDKLIAELDNIHGAFEKIRSAKAALNGQAATIEDPVKLAAINTELADLLKQEQSLKIKAQELIVQAKEMDLVRKQESERARQIKQDNSALEGSYNNVKKQIKELYDAVKATPQGTAIAFKSGNVLGYDQAIEKLKQLMATEQEFRRQFQKDGTLVGEYTTGIIQAFQRMGLGDLVQAQADQAKSAINSLDAEFLLLREELTRLRATGTGGFDAIEREMIQNRQAAANLENQLHEIRTAMGGIEAVGAQMTEGLGKGFKDLGGQLKSVVIGYVGFQALISGVTSSVDNVKELSDQTTNLEIELDKTAGGANKLTAELGKLNTRTKLTQLEDIANIAAKAGTSEQNLVGVAQAIDKIKVAFGKDFGDVETGTESLVKIINIFEGPDAVNGENLLRTGNAIRTLANESVASVPFLNDFTKRMAGLKGTFDVSLPSVLGMASGFENFGQSAEVSSTALVKIIPKLAEDIDKFAAIAGVTRDQFSQLINTNPAEAFLKVAQALVQTKGGVEQFSTAFADSELGSGRVASIVGVAGKNADTFREKIALAGKSMLDTSNIENAFNAKNENLAAVLDKISKKFADAASSRAFQVTLLAIASVVSFLLSNMGLLIGVFGTYGAILAIANAAQIRLWASTLATNVAFKAQYAWMVISETFTKAYVAAVNLLTAAQQRAAAASTLLRVSLSLLGIGAVIAVIAALVAVFNTAHAAVTGTTLALREHARQLQIEAEIRQKANERIADTIAKLDVEKSVLESSATSADTKRAALNRLIEQYPLFAKALDGEKIKLNELKAAYDEVTKSIRLQAEAQVSSELSADQQKRVLSITTLRQRIETEASLGKNNYISIGNLTEDQQRVLFGSFFQGTPFTNTQSRLGGSIVSQGGGTNVAVFKPEDVKKITDLLLQEETNRQKVYQSYLGASSKKQQELREMQDRQNAEANASLKAQADKGGLTLGQLQDLIDAIDKENKTLKEGDPKLKANIEERANLQKRLNDALGKTKEKPSSLSAGQKDQFKDIEAAFQNQKVALETAYAEEDATKKTFNGRQIDNERAYQEELLKINETAINKKLAQLNGSNAAEREKAAELRLDLVNLKKATNTRLYELDLQALNDKKARDERAAKDARDAVVNNPASSPVEKSAAEAALAQRMVEIQIGYNADADELEKNRNKQSIKNQQERSDALQKDEEAAAKARLEVVRKENEQAIQEIKADYDARTQVIRDKVIEQATAIFNSNKSAKEKKRLLDLLENASAQELLENYLARIDSEMDANLRLFNAKRINAEEFNKRDRELREQRFKDIQDKNAKELTEEQKKEQRKREIQDAALSIVGTYFSTVFELQNRQIDKNFQEAKSLRDAERQKKLDLAQSQADKDAINAEYDQKDKEAEQKRNAERQATAKKQLAIEFAIASIKALSTSLNIYDGLIKEAVVLAEYGSKLALINSQQFKFGGIVPTSTGGDITGPSHAQGGVPFAYEAEGGELAIINKRSAAANQWLSVSGTPKMIASAINTFGGGVNFMPGAAMRKLAYGGVIGGNVQPPVFASYTRAQQPAGSATDIEDLKSMIMDLSNIIYSESIKPVQLNPNDVTKFQKARSKSASVATI